MKRATTSRVGEGHSSKNVPHFHVRFKRLNDVLTAQRCNGRGVHLQQVVQHFVGVLS